MPGERFSYLYTRPENPAPDSGRARHRIGALFHQLGLDGHMKSLAAYVGQHLGVSLPGDGRHSSCWHQFIRECSITDFLDTLTLVYRYLFWHVSEGAAGWWREAVRKIFGEERLAYEIDDVGGVHPRVDQEFQRNVASAIAGLESERYKTVRELLERASGHLCAQLPNYKQALRATWSAVDALLGLMFVSAQLSADEVVDRLRPLIEGIYEGDRVTQQAALGMLGGLHQWIEATKRFRYQPGIPESAELAADVAVLSIGCGTAFLRWLVGIDQHMTGERDIAA
jgi:hypothetical protein